MTSSFWTWAAIAGALAVGLLLVFGAPGTVIGGGEDPVATATEAEPAQDAQYWEPVAAATQPATTVVTTPTYNYQAPATTGCSSCGIQQVAGGVPTTTVIQSVAASYDEPLVMGCHTCGGTVSSTKYLANCAVPAQPCAGVPCGELTRPCATAASYACTRCGAPVASSMCGVCGTPCPIPCVEKPSINRNLTLCVDECSYIQLHSTIPHPICDAVSIEWSATRGSFLNPHDADPIYYAPGTRSALGEDVWVMLTVVDQYGVRYTDKAQVHINNTQ